MQLQIINNVFDDKIAFWQFFLINLCIFIMIYIYKHVHINITLLIFRWITAQSNEQSLTHTSMHILYKNAFISLIAYPLWVVWVIFTINSPSSFNSLKTCLTQKNDDHLRTTATRQISWKRPRTMPSADAGGGGASWHCEQCHCLRS